MTKPKRSPIEVEVEQRSDAWLALRKGRLTTSNFAAAARLSKFKGPAKLWRDMTGQGEEFVGNQYTEWGTRYEPWAEYAFEEVSGLLIDPAKFVIDERDQWIGCSPDGWTGEGRSVYLEIKCPWSGRFPDPAEGEDLVPAWYMAQVQGGMEVCDKEHCLFIYYRPKDESRGFDEQIQVAYVPRNREYGKQILSELRAFMQHVVTRREPPAISAKSNPRPTMPVVDCRLLYSGPVVKDAIRERLGALGLGPIS